MGPSVTIADVETGFSFVLDHPGGNITSSLIVYSLFGIVILNPTIPIANA
jgi:hypothetical protein